MKFPTFAIFVPARTRAPLGFVSEIMQVYKYYIEGPFHMTNPRPAADAACGFGTGHRSAGTT